MKKQKRLIDAEFQGLEKYFKNEQSEVYYSSNDSNKKLTQWPTGKQIIIIKAKKKYEDKQVYGHF